MQLARVIQVDLSGKQVQLLRIVRPGVEAITFGAKGMQANSEEPSTEILEEGDEVKVAFGDVPSSGWKLLQ